MHFRTAGLQSKTLLYKPLLSPPKKYPTSHKIQDKSRQIGFTLLRCVEKKKTSFYKRGKTNQCKSWKFIVILWLINQAGMTLPLVWCHSPVQNSLNQTDRGIRQRAETRTLSLPASSSPASTLPSVHAFCLGKVSNSAQSGATWSLNLLIASNLYKLWNSSSLSLDFIHLNSSEIIWTL